jgi:Leucine rich repeat
MSIPQLSTMASTCLINHLGYRENEEACEELFKVWEELYDRKDLHPCLESVMNKIENLVIKEFAQGAAADVQKEALQKNVYRLFSELAKTCGVNPISTDPNVYNSCSLCKAHDEALEIIWSTRAELKHLGLKKASDIRAWMKNSKNALLLKKVKNLDLDDLELKVIPLELLKYLPDLTMLSMSNNQITAIPAEELATSKITSLVLFSNQITDIPKELADSKLTTLCLNGNKITHIPEELANSKLRELYLNGNGITHIPEAFANSKLVKLALEYNRITHISEAIADWKEDSIMELSVDGTFCSEKIHLFLEGNKITHIGGQCLNADNSLIETISEEFNDLDTQVVYGASEQGSCCTIL